eukprot:628520-Hanusia_phi.AAC.1
MPGACESISPVQRGKRRRRKSEAKIRVGAESSRAEEEEEEEEEEEREAVTLGLKLESSNVSSPPRLTSRDDRVDHALRLLAHKLPVVVADLRISQLLQPCHPLRLHIVSVLAPAVVLLPHGRGVVGQEDVAVVAVIARHCLTAPDPKEISNPQHPRNSRLPTS